MSRSAVYFRVSFFPYFDERGHCTTCFSILVVGFLRYDIPSGISFFVIGHALLGGHLHAGLIPSVGSYRLENRANRVCTFLGDEIATTSCGGLFTFGRYSVASYAVKCATSTGLFLAEGTGLFMFNADEGGC